MEWSKNKDRNQNIKSLRKEGYSIGCICTELNVCRSIVSYHCRGIKIDHKTKFKKSDPNTASKQASLNWKNAKIEIEKQAVKEWVKIQKDPMMMGFLGLYWGEGTKKGDSISIVNNDPGIILASLKIFKILSPNAKLEIVVRVYPDHDPVVAKIFWESMLKLPVKIKDKKWVGKLHRAHSQKGLCSVRYSDWKIKIRILKWIELWREKIVRETGVEPALFASQMRPPTVGVLSDKEI